MRFNPVVILGMHRSGTSLITSCLEDLGLFVGAIKDLNYESWFFLNLNNWMLRQANASWDNPYNFQFINDTVKKEILRVLEIHLGNFFTRKSYLGWSKALNTKTLNSLIFPGVGKTPATPLP